MKFSLRDERPAPAPWPQENGGRWCCAEDAAGQLLAAVHLQPEAGRSRARYSFHLGRVVHAAPDLGLHQVQTTLQLGHDATGEAELSGLFLAPALTARMAADPAQTLAVLGALLQQALACLDSPAPLVIVELPGWRNADGRSPFWDGLVQHFLPAGTPVDAYWAQRLGPAFSTHLGAMLPRQLIHAAFLPAAAQQALGRCDAAYAPWLAALQRAGFADWRHCRIEDGGPLLAMARAERAV